MGLNGNINWNLRTSSGQAFPTLESLTYWGNSLDNFTIQTEKGTGGLLKEMPCIELSSNESDYIIALDSSINIEESGIYEYYLEFVLDELVAEYRYIYYAGATGDGDKGFNFRIYNAGFLITVCDGLSRENINQIGVTYFKIGLNKLKLTFDTTNKNIYVDVNDITYDFTHSLSGNISMIDAKRPYIGKATSGSLVAKLVYFSFAKNSILSSEYIFSNHEINTGEGDYVYDLIGSSKLNIKTANESLSTQDLINTYRNGYDLYWDEETLRYNNAHPISSLGVSRNTDDLTLFKRVSNLEIGYQMFNYIEMPEFDIFDTSNRIYWKVSIESDAYYVGDVIGKEKYFHKTWLNYEWIQANIETDYQRYFFIRQTKKHAQGQGEITIKISDILYLNEIISYTSKNRDINLSENLGDFYLSKILNFDEQTVWHSQYNIAIVYDGRYLFYSEDYGKTIINTIDWSTQDYDISAIRITENGNIIILTAGTNIYVSTDNLVTVETPTLLDKSGNPFVFHTPVDADYPGGYFTSFNGFIEYDGVLVFGNYGNSGVGASPTILWYSLDDGLTWEVFYEFGQNASFTDDGSILGGTGGTLLGDSTNPLITRHIHGVNVGFDGNIYVCTGDNSVSGDNKGEMHLLKCIYNSLLDEWTVTDLLDVNSTNWQRMRGIGVYEKDGYLYWGGDGGGTFTYDGIIYDSYGMYRSLVANINDASKHELLQELDTACYTFLNDVNTNKVICGLNTPSNTIYISEDYGKTWEEFTTPFSDKFDKTYYDKILDSWFAKFSYVVQKLY